MSSEPLGQKGQETKRDLAPISLLSIIHQSKIVTTAVAGCFPLALLLSGLDLFSPSELNISPAHLAHLGR